MTFSLNTIILEPLSKEKPKNAVILCHGYGGDGKDIAILASYWRAHLTETIFLCPDAPEKCAASPTGFQWFDLMDQTPEQILSKSLVAENKLNKLSISYFENKDIEDELTQISELNSISKENGFYSLLSKLELINFSTKSSLQSIEV